MSTRMQAQAEAHAPVQVSRARAGLLQRKCACGGAAGLAEKCEECGREKLTLQRRAAGPAPRTVPPIVHEVVGSSGQPLDASTRAFMESRFGHDFSQVRLHTDGKAAESARAVGAVAYTVGSQIAFAAGQYSPGTASGRRLLAHEMTHVLQQSGGGTPQIQFEGRAGDRFEAEADAVADRVVGTSTTAAPQPARVAHTAPVTLMRQTAPEKTCDPPTGPVTMPDKVSDTLIDRLMGKFAKKDEDPGEGCIDHPYVAGIQEDVCTIGYGHQIRKPDCLIVRKDNNQPLTKQQKKTKKFDPDLKPGAAAQTRAPEQKDAAPTQPPAAPPAKDAAPAQPPAADEKKEGDKAPAAGGGKDAAGQKGDAGQKAAPAKKKAKGSKPAPKPADPNEITIDKLKCACEGKVNYDCKGTEAKQQLSDDANGARGGNYVRDNVPVSLNQEQFDALVDITLHRGSIPPELLDAIKKYWCTNRGKNYVRELYLNAALTREHSDVIEPGFVKRRQLRVWPKLPEEPETPAASVKKAPTPTPKKVEEGPKQQPQAVKPLTLLPASEPESVPSLIPNTPPEGPVAQAAREVEAAKDWARQLLQKGLALRGRLDSSSRPTETELKSFGEEESKWRSAVVENIKRYKQNGRDEAANQLGSLLDRVGPKLTELRTQIGAD